MSVDYTVISLADHLPDPVTGEATSQRQRILSIVDQAVRAEELGYRAFGLGEHHFGGYIMPAPELVLAACAARTSRIALGTSVSLLANLDPVRFAEQLCVLDVLCDGRSEITFARGASQRTIEAFGIETFDELRPRFAEALGLVLRLLTEEGVDWEGRYRTPLVGITIQPRPIQQPHPPIWIGGGLSEVSADLAAETGLPFMLPSLFRWPADYADIVAFHRERADHYGTTDSVQIGFPSYVHVAPTSQGARERWRPYLEAYQTFASAIRGSHGRPTDYESLLAGPAIVGSPAQVTEELERVNELLGLSRHLLLMDVGGMPLPLVFESMELLAGSLDLQPTP